MNRGNRIVLAGNQQLAGDLVRHEMLHVLLMSADHPRWAFIDRCDVIVVRTGSCVIESDPAPPPDAKADSIPLSELEIEMEVTPAAPGSNINGGNFMLIVSVRNNASTPVIARLLPSGDTGPPLLYDYSYRERSGAPSTVYGSSLLSKHASLRMKRSA